MKNHRETENTNLHDGCGCDHPEDIMQQPGCCDYDTDRCCNNEEGPIEPSDITEADLKQTIDKLQQQLTAANDKYLRLYAEFENFRRRTAQERLTLMETAGEKILQLILPIIDDFERALTALRQKNVSVAAVEEGVELIHDKLMHLLEQAGVQAMKLDKGSPFDAELQEAITKTSVSDPALQGKVVDVIEKGYLLKNKVLRYAKVIIGE